MRKPNGYGAVIKLQGNRRKPYAVRITTGWDYNAKQRYKYLGYYRTAKEAEIALADYNKNPFVIIDDITFKDLYERYSEAKYKTLAEQTVRAYTSAYNSSADLYNIPIAKLTLPIFQSHVDNCPQNKPMLKSIKALWSNMFKFAIRNQWLPPERKAIITAIDISEKRNPNAVPHKPLTNKELKILWSHADDPRVRYILLLCYTGVRISELLYIPDENIHLDERYFKIGDAKTEAGVRIVPIAEKVLPFMDDLYRGTYQSFSYNIWKPCMREFNFDHRPHDTRHTCASLLASKKVDDRIIRAIIGHKGDGITERVYTHFPLNILLEAINLI